MSLHTIYQLVGTKWVRIINERTLPTNARGSEQYFSVSTNECASLESQMRWWMSCKADRKGKVRKMVENNIVLDYFLFERILEKEKKVETMGIKDWEVEKRKTEIKWKSRGKYKEQETNSRKEIERVRKSKEKSTKNSVSSASCLTLSEWTLPESFFGSLLYSL